MSEVQTTREAELEQLVFIIVNEQRIRVPGGKATGLQIKAYAVEHGVNIRRDFVLHQHLPNGSAKVIGDHDVVVLIDGSVFTAIAPDDNS